MKSCGRLLIWILFVVNVVFGTKILIPMDEEQSDHLRAYGVVYQSLKNNINFYWLLNYRGGSFSCEYSDEVINTSRIYGVSVKIISDAEFSKILKIIASSNMEKIKLEKAPKIAVYTPLEKLPWDDAVTLALTYAKIDYDKIYDKEILSGKIYEYDWLHLHHEDFTGQYSKFYASFGNTLWYQRQKMKMEKLARSLGFNKVSECKKAVALAIKDYVEKGGFLFAMCSATNTLDIALAAVGTDIVDKPFDGDGIDPDYNKKLNFKNCFAFENFTIETSPYVSYFANIDINRVNSPQRKDAKDFVLFDFSAKLDPVPAMLTQDHVRRIKGFYGLLTSFNKNVIKKSVTILGYVPNTNRVKYIYGVKGKGQFAFYGGHDPEDYAHLVGDKPTDLSLHKHSPGYRLILNNVLFPAAEKKEKKT